MSSADGYGSSPLSIERMLSTPFCTLRNSGIPRRPAVQIGFSASHSSEIASTRLPPGTPAKQVAIARKNTVSLTSRLASGFAGPFTLFDQFPKLARFTELIVLRHRQFAAEKEIPKCVLVQDAMH